MDLTDHKTIVRSTGPADGRPLLFIHSAALDRHVWDGVISELPQYRAISYDLRGHGFASEARILTVDQLVADIVGILDALSIERVDIVGLSLGGLIGQRIGALLPERIRSLVLMATAASIPTAPLVERAASMAEIGRSRTVETTLDRWFGTSWIDSSSEPVTYARRCLNSISIADWTAVWTAMAGVDLIGGLSGFKSLVTCMAGGADTSIPPSALQSLANTAPRSRFHEINGAPHLFPLTHRQPVCSLIADHLNRC